MFKNVTYIQNPNYPTDVTTAGVFTYTVNPSNAAGKDNQYLLFSLAFFL